MINSIEAHIIAKKDDYSQIKFELEVKKEKKFRSSYKVSPNEEILAYLLKTVPLRPHKNPCKRQTLTE